MTRVIKSNDSSIHYSMLDLENPFHLLRPSHRNCAPAKCSRTQEQQVITDSPFGRKIARQTYNGKKSPDPEGQENQMHAYYRSFILVQYRDTLILIIICHLRRIRHKTVYNGLMAITRPILSNSCAIIWASPSDKDNLRSKIRLPSFT